MVIGCYGELMIVICMGGFDDGSIYMYICVLLKYKFKHELFIGEYLYYTFD